jgi:molybdate transport system substrate-binding protein
MPIRRCALVLPMVLAATLQPALAQSKGEVHVAAAADLQVVLPTLAAEYEKTTGVKIVGSYGSSATLAQQIQNGAPQDVFLSADFVHPEQLIAAKLAHGLDRPNSPTEYARGVLVLWARKDSPVQPLTIDALKSDKLAKVAIANPLHAPYGLAAQQAIDKLGLTATLTPKLAVAENVAQSAQFAESGNAQAGFISLTLASSPRLKEIGTFVRVPTVYPEIHQTGVILDSSKHPAEAEAFLRWLTSKPVQARLSTFGLDPAQ